MKLMKTPYTRPALRGLAFGLAATALASYVATATPYATCLTNNAGVVSFRLNEAATTVLITWNGGLNSTNLGAKSRGLTVTNLSGAGITAPWYVQVIKVGNSTISTNNQVAFNYPRGVAVNFYPKDTNNFGRVFVGNTVAGTKGQGVYILRSDLTDIYGAARTGGIVFGTGGSAPWRLAIGEDDGMLYMCDWTDNNGNLYVSDQDVNTNSVNYALQRLGPCLNGTTNAAMDGGNPVGYGNNHGSLAAVAVIGSTNNGNLTIFTCDEDLQDDRANTSPTQMNSVWRYDLGSSAFPYQDFYTNRLLTPNVQFVSNVEGLSHGPGGTNGYLYFSQGRANGYEPGVYVITNVFTAYQYGWNNVNVWNSYTASRALGQSVDILLGAVSCSVSRDGRWLASFNYQNNVINVVRLTNGIPDLSRRAQFTGLGTAASGRDIAWDAADNLIYSSHGTSTSPGLASVYHISLGLTATNITGSDGTFTSAILPVVSVTPTVPTAHRTDVNGQFTFYRDGDLSAPLTVTYTVGGTATNGVDYSTIPATITFGAGEATTNLTITPLASATPQAPKTVVITLAANNNLYNLVEGKTASVVIADNSMPTLSWARNYIGMYERLANDFCRFTITRTGETNVALTAFLEYGGQGTLGVDYNGPTSVSIPAGTVTKTVEFNPMQNYTVEGSLVPTVTLAGDYNMIPDFLTNYVVTAGNTNTPFTIFDSDLPTEVTVWSDNFDVYGGAYDTNALPPGWTCTFGAFSNATIALNRQDYSFQFGNSYSTAGFPAPPTGGSPFGLRATVNKFDANALAAGLNFYPVDPNTHNPLVFSNNYALRFHLGLIAGATANTEHALFGINHSGTKTNYNRNGGLNNLIAKDQDGLWFSVTAAINSGWDFCMWSAATGTGTSPATLTNLTGSPAAGMNQVFKNNGLANGPYAAFGAPGCAYNGAVNWADVEVSQINNFITLKINNQVIIATNNPTAFTSGDIMIGYNDMYDSVGDWTNSAGYFDNVRVLQLPRVVTPPADLVVAPGGTATFTVVAADSSTGLTNYQWQFNGVNIQDQTNATLTLNNVQLANYGAYTVIVSDGQFSVSATANLVVLPPEITVGSGTGLRAGYWTVHTNTAPFTGNPTVTRVDANINNIWGSFTGPANGISPDYFTARWVGQVQALSTNGYDDSYTFQTVTDDGVRLWVNGQLVIDSWVGQSPTALSGTITLNGTNMYDIVMEYFEQTGGAQAQLYWSNANTVGYSIVPQSQLYPAASVLPAVALTPASSSYLAPATIPLAAAVTTNNEVIQYVSFYTGATLLASVTNPPYAYSWSGLAAGTYPGYARVYYNTNWTVNSVTNTFTVTNLPPTISLDTPTNGASFSAPANITLSASVNSNLNTISYVGFYEGANLIAYTTNTPYTVNTNSVGVGTYGLWAKAFYGTSSSVTSATNTVSVSSATPPNISGISVSGGNSVISGTTTPNRTLVTEKATSLVVPITWTPIQTNNAASDGTFSITNAVGADADAFFRVKGL